MNFTQLSIPNAYCITLHPSGDERGSFTRIFCQNQFRGHNLQHDIKQVNTSYNQKKSTLRGMHFQAPPHEEAKLVQCIQGAIFDVLLDLREDSPAYLQWHSLELRAGDSLAVYIPEGVAHGFLTLEDNSTVLYHMFHDYHPQSASGVLWNDPAFNIQWPFAPAVISKKDAGFPLYKSFNQ